MIVGGDWCSLTNNVILRLPDEQVKEITRVFKVENCELSYVVEMATSLTDLQPHLRASLKKL